MVAVNEYTTIGISKETKLSLDSLKVHHRESYDEVLNRIIKEKKNKI